MIKNVHKITILDEALSRTFFVDLLLHTLNFLLSILMCVLHVSCFIDIDECADGSHQCTGNQLCSNRQGSYICQCPPGYRLNNLRQCQDVNECESYFGNVCIKICFFIVMKIEKKLCAYR